MSESGIFLDYRGPLDFEVIDSLLRKLKKSREFKDLNKITGKRVYFVVVECLENILKHAELELSENPATDSHITVSKINDKIIVNAGNPVAGDIKENIVQRLEGINNSDEKTLKSLYENKIRSELLNNERCAGLG